jgi:hypothetical protein
MPVTPGQEKQKRVSDVSFQISDARWLIVGTLVSSNFTYFKSKHL